VAGVAGGVHGPADRGVAARGGDSGDDVEQPVVGAGQTLAAEGGDQLHHERLGDHQSEVEQQGSGEHREQPQRRVGGAARRGGARHQHRRQKRQAHDRQARADPAGAAAPDLQPPGDAQLQQQVGDGAGEEEQADGPVPAGGLSRTDRQQQVELVLHAVHADHGE
jgi:hypothetical protein